MQFFKLHTIYSLAFVGLTAATGDTFTADYNDVGLSLPIGVVGPPTPYKGLNYTSVVVSGADAVPGVVASIGGVIPQSPPNVIVTSLRNQLLSIPSVTVAAPYKSGTFISLFFGCNVNAQEAAATVAVNCTISVKGYDKYNKQIASDSKKFIVPPGPVNQKVPQTEFKFPSAFKKVYKLTFVQDSPVTQALLVDDLKYALSKS